MLTRTVGFEVAGLIWSFLEHEHKKKKQKNSIMGCMLDPILISGKKNNLKLGICQVNVEEKGVKC